MGNRKKLFYCLLKLHNINLEPLKHIEFTEKPLARSVLSGSSEALRIIGLTENQLRPSVLNVLSKPLRHAAFTDKRLALSVLNDLLEPLRHVSFTEKQPHLKILNDSDISIAYSKANVKKNMLIKWKITAEYLMAINKKADMLANIGVQFSKSMYDTVVCFDNSIAYSAENVKCISETSQYF